MTRRLATEAVTTAEPERVMESREPPWSLYRAADFRPLAHTPVFTHTPVLILFLF